MSSLLRDLTSELIAELGLKYTSPGNLIMIEWPGETPSCLATFGDVTVMGYDWLLTRVVVSNLFEDSTGKASGMLTFLNDDLTWGAIALGRKFTDVPVKIWDVYAGAIADGDVAQRFSGVGDTSKILSNGQVQVNLSQQGSGTMFCPRGVLGPPLFNHLPAAKYINYGGQQYQLQPSQQ